MSIPTNDRAIRFNLANNLWRCLRRQKMSQRALAEAVGSSSSTITRLLQAVQTPSATLLARLAVALKTTPNRLLADSPTQRGNS